MSSSASSSVSPAPKNSGAEPIPPKLPHPSAILATVRAGGPGAAPPVVTRGIQSNRQRMRQPRSGPRRDSSMTLELINPPDLPTPLTYSHVVVATGSTLVFVAGQEPEDEQGRLVSSKGQERPVLCGSSGAVTRKEAAD